RRATGIYALFVIVIVILFGYIPFPYNFKAPGMLEGGETRIITNGTSGKIAEVKAANGEYVEKDDTLFSLENNELGYEIEKVDASLRGAKLTLRKSMVEMPADMAPIRRRIHVYNEKKKTLEKRSEKLNVISPLNGVWVSPEADGFQGKWISRGDSLGMIIDTSKYVFVSVIPQSDVSHYFADSAYDPEVKISGQANMSINVDSVSAVPMEHTQLPSAALGWYGGGEIEVSQSAGGKSAVEPFYVLNAYLKDTEKDNGLLRLHGRTGKIKFSLGKKPLFWQAWHRIRQLIQKHYHV
ncbi:MAG: biotin/lipoyl-binding protein, partial [Chitinivibrionales bacterium]